MNNQQLYKANLSANSGDNLYYQHIQCQASNQTLNHSYDSVDLEESMSPSPHLALDTREAVLPNRAKSHISVDHARQTNWAHAGTGNHAEGRSNLDSYGQSLPWDSQVQNEATDAYHSSYFPQLSDNQHKVHSGGVHKLDSFTQVFAKRNLRIQASAQGIHEQQPSQMDTDSALRQLLTLKSTGSQQTRPPDSADRYQQAPQHSIASQPQKHHLHALQHPQENYFYDYPQQVTELQSQSMMQQGQHFRQPHQGLAQQSQQLPPPSYYMQPHQNRQQRVSFQEIHQSQQQQFSSQLPPYYQTQSSGEELHHTMHQAQQHNMQSQGYHRDGNQKAESYAQDLSHPMQLIQLGAVPQNFYQNPQAYQHLNKQSMLPQQQASPQKPYLDENQSHVLMDTSVELSNADMLDGFDGEEMNIMESPVSHHQALIHDAAFLMTNREPHPSPNTAWPQYVPDGRPQTTSPNNSRGLYPENPDSKSRLSCLICLKEFRSLPALNGHLKSHGGVRPSAVLKQEEGEKQESNEVDNLTPIVMPVSVPVKLAPSVPSKQVNCNADMDQPESCVSDDEMPVLTRMTYSPPSSPKAASSCAPSEITRKLQPCATKPDQPGESLKPPTERRKYPHRPEPLFIPPPSYSTNSSYSGATLYQSQLRCPRVILDHSVLGKQELPLYTPPPMLSPGRQGSGLFNNVITACHNGHLPPTPLTPSPRVLLCQSNSFGDGSTPVTPGPGEKTVDIEPRINIGSRFQANIPELRSPLNQEGEQHKATLVWKPWPDLENQELRQKGPLLDSITP